ncbi:hypothetical protein CLG96_17655 [Sphingomonas oleivorans]|uniref:(2Fe-2S) ferredoxin domain-containing protein n=1 Tax=Sphingomonas oleivorans TaxID=1735121 RepID=A0A2T5FTH9_9SPHN|nr:hypothetical protein [Sphingomonas oleivorans]PTQ07373.1 hypothetical protein CLG96_17655 [Sphingomonas oleivorans]
MTKKVRSDWQAAILVCRKCEKKLGGGFGPDGDERLAKALRRHAGGGKGRKAKLGIIEVGCLKICPKRAVTVVNGARPGEWLVVRPGTSIDELVGELGLDPLS